MLVFSSQRWKLSPDKYWNGLPTKSQATQWITLFDSRKVQFKLLWIAFDYKTTALTKVAGVFQMVSYQWPIPLALKDIRLIPLMYWVKFLEHYTATEWRIGEEWSTWMCCKMPEIKKNWKTTKQIKTSLHACAHADTHKSTYPEAADSAGFHSLWL